MNYLIAAIVVSTAIIIHELGHLLVAKALKIPIKRFSIGFGPRLLSWRYGEGNTEYCLSAVPFGGYVLPDLKGSTDLSGLSLKQRILFAGGGPIVNLIAAVLFFSVTFIAFKGLNLQTAIFEPLHVTVCFLEEMLLSLGAVAEEPNQLSGVIGVVNEGAALLQNGSRDILLFSGLINLNVALFNMLPLPVLDGGHILLSIMEKVLPGIRKIRIPLAIGGWIIILGLIIYTTSNDVVKLIGT